MLRSRVLTILLLISWLFCGAITELAGFFGFFQFWLCSLLLIPLLLLCKLVWQALLASLKFPRFEQVIFGILCFVWLLHLLQVFVPETGFDAVWYHLPIAQLLSEQQQLVYDPQLYQTANPLFADAIFALGFLALQSFGTKLVAYGFALSLAAVAYRLARVFLSRKWSLIGLSAISLFQVVSWQAASFYIDIAKAFFDLAGLWILIETTFVAKKGYKQYKQKYLLLAGLAFSASLASKEFSILLLPFILFGFVSAARKTSVRFVPLLIMSLVALPLPFYLFAQQSTGYFFAGMVQHLKNLATFTTVQTPLAFIWERVSALPKFFVALFFIRDYTSPLLGLLPVAVFLLRRQMWQQKRLLLLLVFTINQLTIWWLVPPLSTRYALGGFISGLLIVLVWLARHKMWYLPALVLGITLVLLFPRLLVSIRSLNYLLGNQTQAQYVNQLTDENNRWVFEAWYQKQ
ncbi:MAG: hypothetical protein A2632_02795 [Candidatus Pacebacteria bacterium RIFCSPHIGHO2_01_FULL_46_16]|nr:MAG: hypothetical protein A2632_02795 [Candidatus Pacebacteria bacterium RIFCSPHIGHO2_01_FULL_46_16]OGJ21160.1 MAG: hypothetical protein A3J60_01230 [Candidatus Pacebacteria bacterium RIFCSPHIGHO2_02_FULL_46_9]OGJ38929.1 MAG: hypothetical protein A3A82_02110 [Candidatus Pacebacteria bacterium RIFCSPLOWO2_01_FULL_47_12]